MLHPGPPRPPGDPTGPPRPLGDPSRLSAAAPQHNIVSRQYKNLSTVQNHLCAIQDFVYNTQSSFCNTRTCPEYTIVCPIQDFEYKAKSSFCNTRICLQYKDVFLQYKNLSTHAQSSCNATICLQHKVECKDLSTIENRLRVVQELDYSTSRLSIMQELVYSTKSSFCNTRTCLQYNTVSL